MFYKDGEWLDFPNNILDLVKKYLEMKKSVVEVELNGYHMVFNFFHMYKLYLKTEPYNLSKQYSGKSTESYDSNEIKLQLEIEMNGLDQWKLRECKVENSINKKDSGNVGESIQQNQDIDHAYTEFVYGKLDLDFVLLNG
ncbi:unnamed protein product [Sphenostylis stenocarpa]|uniref:RCD1 WWE domain-containing protein n=1 Tax=Sphenostylis stenocarpa TaxID=92480 RepID=A0AA86W5K9_9FABA|nr:unnamed protein product [Sphenostylis stenocarpa]